LAEIGLVGKAPGRYNLSLGGNGGSTRLNRVYREGVRDAQLIDELRPVLARYAAERLAGERFGDWCARVLWLEAEGAAAKA
jgi:sulfite reductase (NADPH) hemoprotein beta-component